MPIGGSATLLAARALGERIGRSRRRSWRRTPPTSSWAAAAPRSANPGARLSTPSSRAPRTSGRTSSGASSRVSRRPCTTNPAAWTFTTAPTSPSPRSTSIPGGCVVLRYVAVDDCGRIVNPALVEGQIAGGIAQGLGGALMEHCVYDDTGQLLSTTLMDYAVPTCADLPPIETHSIETPAPESPAASREPAKPGDRGARRDPQCGQRRAGAVRRDAHGSADHAGARHAGASEVEIGGHRPMRYPALMRSPIPLAVLTVALIASPDITPWAATAPTRRHAGPIGEGLEAGARVLASRSRRQDGQPGPIFGARS